MAKKTPKQLPPPPIVAKCPVCGCFLSARGDTLYKGCIVPKHTGCPVARGTLIKEGPLLKSWQWSPRVGDAFTDDEQWYVKVTLVQNGMVYFDAAHPKYNKETDSMGLSAWWMKHCKAHGIPVYESRGGVSTVRMGGAVISVSSDEEACAVAFSLARGDHKGWSWGDSNDF